MIQPDDGHPAKKSEFDDPLLVDDPNMDVPDALVADLTASLEAINEFHDIMGGAGSRYWSDSEFGVEKELFGGRPPAECARLAAFSAFDHLHYFARYSVEIRRVSSFAPFTVIRSALTSAATAAWILADRDADVRRERALVFRYQDAINQRNAAAAIVSVPRPHDATPEFDQRHNAAVSAQKSANADIKLALEDGLRCSIDESSIKKKPHDAEIVRIGSSLTADDKLFQDFGITPEVLLHWRSLSAYAHGQSWAALMTVTDHESADGVPVARWSPSHDLLMAGYRITWQTLYGMWVRYGELASSPST